MWCEPRVCGGPDPEPHSGRSNNETKRNETKKKGKRKTLERTDLVGDLSESKCGQCPGTCGARSLSLHSSSPLTLTSISCSVSSFGATTTKLAGALLAACRQTRRDGTRISFHGFVFFGVCACFSLAFCLFGLLTLGLFLSIEPSSRGSFFFALLTLPHAVCVCVCVRPPFHRRAFTARINVWQSS